LLFGNEGPDFAALNPGYALVNNASGNGTGPYQAGISDSGSQDVIRSNYICGPGYPATDSGGLFAIDVTFTNDPEVKDNTICGAGPVAMASTLSAQAAAGAGPKPSPFQ
jgi:hypothetical protein